MVRLISFWFDRQQQLHWVRQQERRKPEPVHTTFVHTETADTEPVNTAPAPTDTTAGGDTRRTGSENTENFAQQVGGGRPLGIPYKSSTGMFVFPLDDEPEPDPPRPVKQESVSAPPTVIQQAPPAVTTHPAATQECRNGVNTDRGRTAWLHLEQAASIIQLHNPLNRITTPILNGMWRASWGTAWAHMRATEAAATEGTRGAAVRTGGNTLLRYGQMFFRHKQDTISGIYPMHIPGHWRLMIVSHALKQIVLLDPFGDKFTNTEIRNVEQAYSGYTLTGRTEWLQTDEWNCGVWVAWIASLWATHVNQGLEGTKDIEEVIQDGILAENILDINTHPLSSAHNESIILRIRHRFKRMVYADSHPAHLTEWLTKWNSSLRDVQAVSSVTHLTRRHRPESPTSSQHINFTEEVDATDSTGRTGNVPTSLTPRAPPPTRDNPPTHTDGRTSARTTSPTQPTTPQINPTPTPKKNQTAEPPRQHKTPHQLVPADRHTRSPP